MLTTRMLMTCFCSSSAVAVCFRIDFQLSVFPCIEFGSRFLYGLLCRNSRQCIQHFCSYGWEKKFELELTTLLDSAGRWLRGSSCSWPPLRLRQASQRLVSSSRLLLLLLCLLLLWLKLLLLSFFPYFFKVLPGSHDHCLLKHCLPGRHVLAVAL
jgi:hypothetical protein